MEFLPELQVEITSESPDELLWGNSEFDFDKIIFDLDSKIEMLSSQADSLDYITTPSFRPKPCAPLILLSFPPARRLSFS